MRILHLPKNAMAAVTGGLRRMGITAFAANVRKSVTAAATGRPLAVAMAAGAGLGLAGAAVAGIWILIGPRVDGGPTASDDALGAVYSETRTRYSNGEFASAPRTEAVKVTVGHGRLLHLDEPVEAVFLGDPSIADVNVVAPDYIYVIGKKLGSTNLIAVSMEGTNSKPDDRKNYIPAPQALKASLRIDVTADARTANDILGKTAPQAASRVVMFGRRAMVTGRSKRPEDAKTIQDIAQSYSPPGQPPINNSTIEGAQQVNIRVRFAEVSRNDLQTLGIDWQMFNAGKIATAMLDGLLNKRPRADANELIDALQRSGVLNVLAEPNLTAVTGEEASFLAGGEVPVPVPQGNNMVTMTYKPYGVSLAFKPTLVRENRIALHIKPEVSMISNIGSVLTDGNRMPSFSVRRAETTVEVASGQTFAIGGLFQREIAANDEDVNKAPVLGDMPVLGQLFRSPRFRRHETELVILITPYLVDPVSDRMLALPSDRPYAPGSPVPEIAPPPPPEHLAGEVPPGPRPSVKETTKKGGPSAGLYLK